MNDAPAIHFDVTDENGETFRLVAVKRKGRMHLQRLAPGLYDLSQASPRRLEHLAAFGRASRTSTGSRMTGPMPPSSDAVTALVPEAAKHYVNPRQSKVVDRQAYYRELIGEREVELAAVSLGVKDVREMSRVPFARLGLPPTQAAMGNRLRPGRPPL